MGVFRTHLEPPNVHRRQQKLANVLSLSLSLSLSLFFSYRLPLEYPCGLYVTKQLRTSE